MLISIQSGLQARVPSARLVFGRWSWPQATGRGGAGARYDTDFNSAGGDDSGPGNAHYSVDAGDLNAKSARHQTIVDTARSSGAETKFPLSAAQSMMSNLK